MTTKKNTKTKQAKASSKRSTILTIVAASIGALLLLAGVIIVFAKAGEVEPDTPDCCAIDPEPYYPEPDPFGPRAL